MQNKIAQLEKELILVSGEKRVDLLNELAFLYRGIDILKSKESAFEALELSQKIEYEVGIAESYFQLTEIFTNTDFEKAYVYIEKALELFDASNYEKGVAKALKAQAGLYFQQGDYPTSLKINLTALRMSEILKDDELIIMLVNAIARIHEKQKSYHTARNYYYKAYKIAKRTKNYRGQAALLVNLGVSNLAEKNYILAKKHLHKALSISEEMGNRLFIASILVNFGKIAYEEEDYQTGEQHLYQALSLFQELDNKESISFTQNQIAILLYHQKQYSNALEYAKKSLGIAKALKALPDIRNAFQTLAEISEKTEDYKSAYHYLKKYQEVQQEIFSNEKSMEITNLEVRFEIEQKKRKTKIARPENVELKHQNQLEEIVIQHTQELNFIYDSTIEGWARALELRNIETEGHSRRVSKLTVEMARRANTPEEDLIHIRRGALLHDIGKMGIPDSVFLKEKGRLTKRERKIIERHPEYGYKMLSPISFLKPALDIPLCHHEKWDGTGYPQGLKGDDIPKPARIFAVVDVWDALRSERPYKKAWSDEKALAYIKEQAGKHFDPKIVELFLEMINEST